MRVFDVSDLACRSYLRLSSVVSALWVLAFVSQADALEITIVADEVTTQTTVITQTNGKGFNVVFWNFQLPASFTGTGAANTVTSMSFRMFQDSPQSGAGVIPENIAIYSGFFDPGKYSTVQGSSLFKPIGNSYADPISTAQTPADGINTVRIADPNNSQLNMGTLTPGVNEKYGVHNFAIPTTQNPFNGTTGNASGQYSLVIWTESQQNYHFKGGNQLRMSIPGVSGILTSTSPGYLDGSGGGAGVITAAGSLAIAPVPEPSTIVMGGIASAVVVFVAWRKRGRAVRKSAA